MPREPGTARIPKAGSLADDREKVRRVGAVFDSVAGKYDVMNDVMSLGVHRLWKRFAIELSGVRKGQRVLDLAGGTGDLAVRLARMVGPDGEVVLADINAAMLEHGRARLLDQGIAGNVRFVQANAECLPFPDNHFDCITIAFGLRNVTDKDAALASMYRVLKPGGRLLVLEFSKPTVPGLAPLYDLYSFKLLPLMGKLIANDAASYQYLAESIRMHPDQDTLRAMMAAAGFEDCGYHNLSGASSPCRRTSPTSSRNCRTACRRSPARGAAPSSSAPMGEPVARCSPQFDETPLAAASIAQVHAAPAASAARTWSSRCCGPACAR
jgi:demethylmenaquinone methyltransferase / 2-methoxy-6-polyprenyl-1,4-benzoquinol methylase